MKLRENLLGYCLLGLLFLCAGGAVACKYLYQEQIKQPPKISQELAERVKELKLNTNIISPIACYVSDHEPTEQECWLCAAGREPPGVVYCQYERSGWKLTGDPAIIKRITTVLH